MEFATVLSLEKESLQDSAKKIQSFGQDVSNYNLLYECRVVLLVLFLSIVNRYRVLICVTAAEV